MKPIILLDPGHGAYEFTPGKYSPLVTNLLPKDPSIYNGRFREGNFSRLVVNELMDQLRKDGLTAMNIVTEERDIALSERCRRVNKICAKYGAQNCLLISVHANTAGNEVAWSNARGWLGIVDDAASTRARDFANLLFDAVADANIKTRQPSKDRKYYYYHELRGKQVRLAILSGTKCPAVLAENLFYTNLDDLKILASPNGRSIIVQYLRKAIHDYVKKYS